MLKGNNNKALAKMFCVYTNLNIVCTTCQKIMKNLFIGKIRCLMRLTRKARVKFKVNEMREHVVLLRQC